MSEGLRFLENIPCTCDGCGEHLDCLIVASPRKEVSYCRTCLDTVRNAPMETLRVRHEVRERLSPTRTNVYLRDSWLEARNYAAMLGPDSTAVKVTVRRKREAKL